MGFLQEGETPHNNMHPAVVMRRITCSPSAKSLYNAVKACSAHLNAAHISAALLRLALLTQVSSGDRADIHGKYGKDRQLWRQTIFAPEPAASSDTARNAQDERSMP